TPSAVPWTPPNHSREAIAHLPINAINRRQYISNDTSVEIVRQRCNLADVDGGQLHRLGRRLIELSRAVTTQGSDPALTPGELAVLEDVLRHPDSSVSEIQART